VTLMFEVFCEDAMLGANGLTTQWRSKNIGGRIAPAAIAGLIERRLCIVNAFRSAGGANRGPGERG